LPEPEPLPTAQIERIDALTAAGRTNWFGLVAYPIFAFITVLGVTDADFFIPSRQTQLPLVNVEIPTKSFFYFAPILATALYAYLHLHIRKAPPPSPPPPPPSTAPRSSGTSSRGSSTTSSCAGAATAPSTRCRWTGSPR
jgi:hypothetical protein